MTPIKLIKILIEQELENKQINPNDPNSNPDLSNIEDPIKNYIDKLIDTKNRKLTDISNSEISNVINNSN